MTTPLTILGVPVTDEFRFVLLDAALAAEDAIGRRLTPREIDLLIVAIARHLVETRASPRILH